jgi:hypothetical protein
MLIRHDKNFKKFDNALSYLKTIRIGLVCDHLDQYQIDFTFIYENNNLFWHEHTYVLTPEKWEALHQKLGVPIYTHKNSYCHLSTEYIYYDRRL